MQKPEEAEVHPKKVIITVKAKPRQTAIDIYDENLKRFFKYTFKDYVKSSDTFTYRCASRGDCNFQIRLPLIENFVIDEEMKTMTYYKFKEESQQIIWTPQDRKKTHTCQFKIEEEKQSGDVKIYQHDKKVLEDCVRKNPLSTASKLKYELDQQRQIFTKEEINSELRRIRAEKYPKDAFLVFTPEYCKSLDDPKQNLFRCYIKTPIGNDQKEYSEILILATQFQLARLAQSSEVFRRDVLELSF